MNNLTVGIVDDEKNNREYIALILEKEFPELNIIFKVKDLEELKEQVDQQEPDILFLDIQLKNGLIFEQNYINHLSSLKIFVTAFQQYALEALKSLAFDYLLKPINHQEFIVATHKAINYIHYQLKPKKNEGDVESLPTTLDLPTSNGYKRVAIDEIIWCEADSSYTVVHLTEKRQLLISKPLANFEEILKDHSFFRIHNKYLINLDHYKEYIKGKGGQVILSDDTVLDVSVRKRAEFIQTLQRV